MNAILAAMKTVPASHAHHAVALLSGIGDAAARIARLPPQQRRVLHLLAEGMSNKQVGHALGISARTVDIHRQAARKRLGVRTSTEAVRIWFLAGLD